MSIEQVNAEARTIELSFSSNSEIERRPGVIEILSHAPGACDLSRLNKRANLLFNHNLNIVLGVVESARIDPDGHGRAIVRFGKSEEAERVWKDVQDKILCQASVGYRVKEVKYSSRSESDSEFYTITKWEPYEISIVTAPADSSVGIGRSLTMKEFMEKTITAPEEVPASAPVEPKMSINIETERSLGRQTEQDRVRAIIDAGKQYSMQDIAMRAIEEGKSLAETKDLFLSALNQRNHKIVDGTKPIGLSEKESRSFSMVKLIRALSSPEDPSARKGAAFELEACSAAADQVSHRSLKGTMIPVDVLTTPLLAQRSGNTISMMSGSGYTGSGGNTVQTHLLAASFIDVLRNRTVIMQVATQLSGLVGNIDIPKQTTTSSGYWIGEDGDANKQDINFGLVSLKPKTVANYGEITRKMLVQPSLSVEMLLRNDLAAGLARAIDKAGFYGDGTSNAPTGIKNTSGIHNAKFASDDPTFKELIAMETAIAMENADVENMALVVNPSFRGYAKTALKFPTASTNGGTIWEGGNTVNGYRTEVTNQISTGDIFFGNFADFLIGLWGGLEITVDPYTHSAKGRIRIVSMQDVDFTIRRAVSFCYGSKQKLKVAA